MSLQTVQIDPRNPDATLAAIANREQERYNTDYAPVEDAAIASVNDLSIINDARENAKLGFADTKGRADRQRRRYGVQTSALDAREQGFALNSAKALGTADTVNNARLDQFDRNKSVRGDLINIGRGVAGQAADGFAQAGSLKTQRNNADRTVNAQNKASTISTVGQIASTALFAAMVL